MHAAQRGWSQHSKTPFTHLVQQIKNDSLGEKVEPTEIPGLCCGRQVFFFLRAKSNMFKSMNTDRAVDRQSVILCLLTSLTNIGITNLSNSSTPLFTRQMQHLKPHVPYQSNPCIHWLTDREIYHQQSDWSAGDSDAQQISSQSERIN